MVSPLIVAFADENVLDLHMEGVAVLKRTDRHVEFAFDPRVTPAHKLIARITADHRIKDLSIEEPTIEETIARFYTSHGAVEA